MKNHFLRFDDDASARAALPDYCPDGEWRDDIVIPNQRVVLARATYDEGGNEITPEAILPGFFITVSLLTVDTNLRDLPDNACRLIGDSETGALVYTAPDLNTELLATAIIEPIPAGSGYIFGGA